MVRIVSWVATLLIIAVVAGCGGSDDDQPTTTPQTTATPDAGGSEPTSPPGADDEAAAGEPPGDEGTGSDEIDPMPGAQTEPISGQATGSGTALLTRLELGRHEGFDRVVLEFRDHLPGYEVAYVSPPVTEDGSGRDLSVQGDALVRIRLEPASSYDFEAQTQAFSARRVDGAGAGTSVVREVVRSGDFEAVLSWVVGLSDRVDYRVSTLSDPPRLVIDFRNH